jgi:hypothetical protein
MLVQGRRFRFQEEKIGWYMGNSISSEREADKSAKTEDDDVITLSESF